MVQTMIVQFGKMIAIGVHCGGVGQGTDLFSSKGVRVSGSRFKLKN